MIVVRVELHSAITGQVTELARMHLCNVGGTRTMGNYSVETFRGRSSADLDKRISQRRGRVMNHARLNDHVWQLVGKALVAVDYVRPAAADAIERESGNG